MCLLLIQPAMQGSTHGLASSLPLLCLRSWFCSELPFLIQQPSANNLQGIMWLWVCTPVKRFMETGCCQHLEKLWAMLRSKDSPCQRSWNRPIYAQWFFFLKILFLFYLTEREITSRQRGRQRERGKQAPCWAESPMRDSIPGPRDHDLSRRQLSNQLSHPGVPPPILPLIHLCIHPFMDLYLLRIYHVADMFSVLGYSWGCCVTQLKGTASLRCSHRYHTDICIDLLNTEVNMTDKVFVGMDLSF